MIKFLDLKSQYISIKEEIDVVTAGCLAKGSSTPTSLYSEESQIGKT